MAYHPFIAATFLHALNACLGTCMVPEQHAPHVRESEPSTETLGQRAGEILSAGKCDAEDSCGKERGCPNKGAGNATRKAFAAPECFVRKGL
jgi:hypothetical protein